jgi:HAMP domain-containing protein
MQGGSGGSPTRFEHLRGLLRRMDRIVDSTRDQRLGRVIVEPTAPAPIPFPKAQSASTSGKPRAVAKSLQDFEAAFARLTDRQVG